METFGDRVAKLRKEKGWTQQELAEKIGYKSKTTVNKVEVDKHIPNLENIARYAVALDCDPAYLCGWQIEVTRPDTEAMLKRLSDYLDRMENLNADKMQ